MIEQIQPKKIGKEKMEDSEARLKMNMKSERRGKYVRDNNENEQENKCQEW